MLAPSLVPVPFASTGGGLPPAATVAALPGAYAQTVQAPPPAIGSPITGDQRRAAGAYARPEAATTPATSSSTGLQPPSLGLVQREFGSSTSFLAQFLGQTGDTALAEAIEFQPSAAGVPAPPQPMLQLARPDLPQPVPAAVPTLQTTSASVAAAAVSFPASASPVIGALPASKPPEAPRSESSEPVRTKAGHQAYHLTQQRSLIHLLKDYADFEPVDAVA